MSRPSGAPACLSEMHATAANPKRRAASHHGCSRGSRRKSLLTGAVFAHGLGTEAAPVGKLGVERDRRVGKVARRRAGTSDGIQHRGVRVVQPYRSERRHGQHGGAGIGGGATPGGR